MQQPRRQTVIWLYNSDASVWSKKDWLGNYVWEAAIQNENEITSNKNSEKSCEDREDKKENSVRETKGGPSVTMSKTSRLGLKEILKVCGLRHHWSIRFTDTATKL